MFVGVNPAQSLPTPAVPVNVSATPPILSGCDGTNLPKMKFYSSIESFVRSFTVGVYAPALNEPPVGVPITWSP